MNGMGQSVGVNGSVSDVILSFISADTRTRTSTDHRRGRGRAEGDTSIAEDLGLFAAGQAAAASRPRPPERAVLETLGWSVTIAGGVNHDRRE
jgi:hypothetical protein